ncbi:MAG: hypothetical protein PHH37_13135 [Paludibacter sp.]|nr:hypothetical protein [Paludibacter sp.]
MVQQKYIRLQKNNTFIIFPEHISHADFEFMHPISAGFCTFEQNEVKCFGQSVSLGLRADKDDSFLATLQIYGIENLFVSTESNNTGQNK